MAREEINNTGMRPTIGMLSMQLPITFDYHGGRKDKDKYYRIWAVILGVVIVFISFAIRFRKDGNLFKNIALAMEEMGRMENRINTRFDKIEQCLESMQHEINACWILNLRPFVDIYSIKMM